MPTFTTSLLTALASLRAAVPGIPAADLAAVARAAHQLNQALLARLREQEPPLPHAARCEKGSS
jgi:hypothetical protein